MSSPTAAAPPPKPATPQRASLFANAALGRIIVLAIGLALLCRDLTGPFIGRHEWNSAGYCVFARNHIAWGLGYTRLYCIWGNTATPPAQPVRYLNHPPLIAAWVALPLLVCGDHEWAARLVPIAATLAGAGLLMVLVGRLHSHGLGVLAGLFYVTLPATAYYGRMVDHIPLAQFFSLLTLHGYVHWSGLYAARTAQATLRPDHPRRSRRIGVACYTLGIILGIGTAWAVVLMAALIWLWNLVRARSDPTARRLTLWLTVIPAAALAAVVLHILAGCGWNWHMFGPLVASRTFGESDRHDSFTALEWLWRNWANLQTSATVYAALAAVIFLALIPLILRFSRPTSPWRAIVRSRPATVPILLTLLQGLLYVVVFANQSWEHDYWQYLMLPFLAVALAAVVLACYTLLLRPAPALAGLAAVLVVALMPVFARGRDRLYGPEAPQLATIQALIRLSQLIPDRVPAMTLATYPQAGAQFGGDREHWWSTQIEYYARRPLIPATTLADIEAHAAECPAYLLELTDSAAVRALRDNLNARYESVPAGDHYLIFLLNRPTPRP